MDFRSFPKEFVLEIELTLWPDITSYIVQDGNLTSVVATQYLLFCFTQNQSFLLLALVVGRNCNLGTDPFGGRKRTQACISPKTTCLLSPNVYCAVTPNARLDPLMR